MKYVILAGLILMANVAFGEIYVAIDKESGEVKGMVDVNPENIGDWAKTYTMKKASEDYRGLKSEEIRFEKGKLRKATKEEIDAVEAAKPKEEILSQQDIKKLKVLIK